MAIRFRCVYCDKLLGIATRKAGSVVNCPQCGQPLIVPSPEPEAVQKPAAAVPPSPQTRPPAPVSAGAASAPRPTVPSPPAAPVPGTVPSASPARANVPAGNLFEQDDFDVILEPEATIQTAAQPVFSQIQAPVPQPPRTFPAAPSLPAPVVPAGYAPIPVPAPIVYDSAGWVLTGPRIAFALLGVGFLVLMAFGLGLLIGRML